MWIKISVNERKCISNRDTHSLSLSQAAKIGLKAFTGARTRPHVTKPNAYSILKTPSPNGPNLAEITSPQTLGSTSWSPWDFAWQAASTVAVSTTAKDRPNSKHRTAMMIRRKHNPFIQSIMSRSVRMWMTKVRFCRCKNKIIAVKSAPTRM